MFLEILRIFIGGFYDGCNIYDTICLITKSTRIRKEFKRIIPIYLILTLINLLTFLYIDTDSFSKTIAKYIAISFPVFLAFTIYSKYWYTKFWENVYSKRNTTAVIAKHSKRDSIRTKRRHSTKLNSSSSLDKVQSNSNSNTSIWNIVGEYLYGFLLTTVFSVQITIVTTFIKAFLLGFVGTTMSGSVALLGEIICNSFIFGWTAYEPKLIKEGQDLYQRIYFFERRWIYFLGFGLPYSIFYSLSVWEIGVCIWFFGVLSLTFRSIKTKTKMKFEHDEKIDKSKIPLRPKSAPKNPYFEIRLRIFWISEKITTKILHYALNKLNVVF